MGALCGLILLAAVCHALVAADTFMCGSLAFTSGNSRIVNGTSSVAGEWPWQVSFQNEDGHFCGGSLINQQWVLSAAHCFQSITGNITVYLGLYRLWVNSFHTVSTTIAQIIINSNYHNPGDIGDIALVKLSAPVNFTQFIMPICLPSKSSATFPCGMECWATGWGATSEGGDGPADGTLQKVMLPLIDYTTCGNMYHEVSASFVIQSEKICAGYKNGGKDSCQGDSGGPLVCLVRGVWYEVGVVSWGSGCARPNRPGVYTLVSAYQDWILNYTQVTFSNVTSIPPPTRTCGDGNLIITTTASSGIGGVGATASISNVSVGTTLGNGGGIGVSGRTTAGNNIEDLFNIGERLGGSCQHWVIFTVAALLLAYL